MKFLNEKHLLTTIALIGSQFFLEHKKCSKWKEKGKCKDPDVKKKCPITCGGGGGEGGGILAFKYNFASLECLVFIVIVPRF